MGAEVSADEADETLLVTGEGATARAQAIAGPRAHPRIGSADVSRRPPVAWRKLAAGMAREGRLSSEIEVERGILFLLGTVVFAVGAIIYFSLPAEPAWTTLILALSGLAAFALMFRGRPLPRFVAVAILIAITGVAAGKLETQRLATKIVGDEISTRVTGRVELVEERTNGRVRITLAVIDTQRPKLRYQPDRIRVTARKVPPEMTAGSVIEEVVRLLPPRGPLRPDSYDFAFESYFDGIGASGFFLRDPVVSMTRHEASWTQRFASFVETTRDALADRIRSHVDGASGEIAVALVAGVRAGIPEEANEALRITGLAHVLSISGLHMALVAGVVIGTLRSGFALFPQFASRRPTRKYAAAVALVVLAIYLLVSGMAVAAQRSFLMIAIMLIAVMFDRAALTMRNLAISALIILAINPHEIMGPSFQMSFAATAALIGAYGWWAQRGEERAGTDSLVMQGRTGRTVRLALLYLAGLMATSLIAGAATGIYGAWHFQRVSPLSLIANLSTMPIVSVIVMPMAVFGMVLMPLGLDGPAFLAMGKGLDWMLDIARILAAHTPIDAIGAIPATAVILFSLALIPLTMATTRFWRLAAVPLLAAGGIVLALRDLPDVLVDENAALVAVRSGDALVVNRRRPNAFVMNDWQRATGARTILPPAKRAGSAPTEENGPVTCLDGACILSPAGAPSVVHAVNMKAAKRFCDRAALIVIADPTSSNPCPITSTRVLTARQLALRGSATATMTADGVLSVRQAIGDPLRPWQTHRRFSRAARGMAPYKPRPRSSAGPPKQTATE